MSSTGAAPPRVPIFRAGKLFALGALIAPDLGMASGIARFTHFSEIVRHRTYALRNTPAEYRQIFGR